MYIVHAFGKSQTKTILLQINFVVLSVTVKDKIIPKVLLYL